MLLMAAIIPLLTSMTSQSHKRPRSPLPLASFAPITPVHTPVRKAASVATPFSPLPGVGSELRACLSDFTETSGFDMTGCKESLADLELTPDIIPDVPVARLCEVTGTVKGRLRKFQAYCKTWNTRFQMKKAQCGEKRQRLV